MKEFTIQGSGRTVRINDNDFKAQKSGGQATVYLQGATAYKVYADSSKMIPMGKIQELQNLTLPEIIRPKDVLLDKSATPVGYSMDAVDDAYVLCQTFPRSFRTRTGLTADGMAALVQKLRDLTQHCHDNGVLVVDLNEMNYLVDKKLDRMYQIDVDSAQTKSFRADALMDSVRDRHAVPNDFNLGTDWFAFAIVAFQMFVGIHPYKGVHPSLNSLDDRMLANVSVFHKDVGSPGAVLPFDVIPNVYQDWFHAVLDKGQRVPPPLSMTAAAIIVAPTIVYAPVTGTAFVVDPILNVDGVITAHLGQVTVSTAGVFVGTRKAAPFHPDTHIAVTPRHLRPIAAWIENGIVRFRDLRAELDLPQTFAAEQIMSTQGRIYLKQGLAINEVGFVESASATIPGLTRAACAMLHATTLFNGLAVQQAFGTVYASFFPKAGVHHSVRITEFEGMTIVDAKFDGGVLVAILESQGKYDRAILRFDSNFSGYDIRWSYDIAVQTINFVVLESGVAIMINDKDEVELFRAERGAGAVKVIVDASVGGDSILFKDSVQALIARAGSLARFSMVKSA